jgi:hypothetical protein
MEAPVMITLIILSPCCGQPTLLVPKMEAPITLYKIDSEVGAE